MAGPVVGAEHDAGAERRRHHHRGLGLTRPVEPQAATDLVGRPVRVQVHDEVEHPVEAEAPVDVEVGVRCEHAARAAAVQAAALQVGIRDQRLDAGEGLERGQRRRRVELLEDRRHRRRHGLDVRAVDLLALVVVLEPAPAVPLEGRERLDHLVGRRAPRRRAAPRARTARPPRTHHGPGPPPRRSATAGSTPEATYRSRRRASVTLQAQRCPYARATAMTEPQHRRPLVRRVGGVAVPYAFLRLAGQGTSSWPSWSSPASSAPPTSAGSGPRSLDRPLPRAGRRLGRQPRRRPDGGPAATGPLVRALVRRRQLAAPILFLAYVAVTGALEPWLWPVGVVVLNRGMNRDWVALGEERGARSALPSVVQGVCLLVAALPPWATAATPRSRSPPAYGAGLVVSLAAEPGPGRRPRRRSRTEGWLLAGSLADQVSLTADTLLLSWLRSARAAGIYAAAYRLPERVEHGGRPGRRGHGAGR